MKQFEVESLILEQSKKIKDGIPTIISGRCGRDTDGPDVKYWHFQSLVSSIDSLQMICTCRVYIKQDIRE